MTNWPRWIPHPTAWMSAAIVILITIGIQNSYSFIAWIINFLTTVSPKLGVLAWFFLLLSPIIVVAFVHHFLHIILDKFFPDTKSPDLENIQGFFPTLMSWWEGLFSLLVIYLSTLVTLLIQIVLFNNYNFSNFLGWWDDLLLGIFTISNFVRLAFAAYLYQFEYLVRQHLLSVGSKSN